MGKKLLLLLLISFTIFSCSNDDNGTTTLSENQVKLVASKTITIDNGNPKTLTYTYNQDNNLVRIETEAYYKTYTYSGENITKIESIDYPDIPYYTVELFYNSNGTLDYTKKTNHFNGDQVEIIQYMYSDNVSSCYVFQSEADFSIFQYSEFYDMRYISGTNNYDEKDYSIALNSVDDALVYTTLWQYDTSNTPYFGEAIEKISLPYVTTGVEVSIEYAYNSNNPVKKEFKETNGDISLGNIYQYTYDVDNYPVNAKIDVYNVDTGEVVRVVKDEYTYIIR